MKTVKQVQIGEILKRAARKSEVKQTIRERIALAAFAAGRDAQNGVRDWNHKQVVNL